VLAEQDVRGRSVCARCVMDTSDPEISFDAHGVCNHCRSYSELADRELRRDPGELEGLVREIRQAGTGKEYDCVIGVSGGVDSTYVAYEVKRLGLRPLAVHLDNGWDSELAIHNIEQALSTLGIDLVTRVLEWDEFRGLQVAFLRASVPDAEIPTDHAIMATLYQEASRRGIRYVLSGDNFATEAILPRRWTYGVHDWRYIKQIHRRFAGKSLSSFPHVSRLRLDYLSRVRRIRVVGLLDYFPYVKSDAMELLQRELGWRPYGGKHYESIYTRFFQGYILPTKFGIDKRKAHLSTLICAGQMTREEALRSLEENEYLAGRAAEDRVYAVKKLGLTDAEFDEIMCAPAKTYEDYPNHQNQPVWRILRSLKRRLIGRGSSGEPTARELARRR
jgi:N-acetyl sugar amidotransferase